MFKALPRRLCNPPAGIPDKGGFRGGSLGPPSLSGQKQFQGKPLVLLVGVHSQGIPLGAGVSMETRLLLHLALPAAKKEGISIKTQRNK
jgi:hypothetical protein